MKKCVIYTRVSTTEQANNGFSLARQKEECINFAKKNGYEVIEVFEERGESAKTTARTELQTMIKYCSLNKKDIDALIVWKSDRLSRNFDDHYALATIFNGLSIKLLFATETNDDSASGKFLRNMIKAVNQFENDTKSERTVAGMKQALLEGKWLWQAPYGYKLINGVLVQDEIEAPFVRRIYTLFTQGLYRQSQIINILAKENVFIKPGRMFNILRNCVYCGKIHCPSLHKEPVKGAFEPIISEETFYKAQALLNGTSKITTSYIRNNPEFPLKQFILCPCCGSPLTASKSTGYKNKKYAYYHCYQKDCKTQVRIPKDTLEDMFVTFLSDIKPSIDYTSDFKSNVKKTYNELVKSTHEKHSKLLKDLVDIEQKKNKLLDFYLEGKIEESEYKIFSNKYENDIQRIKKCIAEIGSPKENFEKCLNFVCNAFENLDKLWLTSDLDTKQRLQQLIFPEGLIYENNGFRIGSNPCNNIKKGALLAPDFNMVPPSEFESLSTP